MGMMKHTFASGRGRKWWEWRRIAGRRRRNAACAWEPTDLGTDLIAWWNADDLSTGAVSSWTDRKGSIALVQATGTAQPAKAVASFNSAYGGVTFDGTADFLAAASFPTAVPIGATPGEIWMLASSVSQGAVGILMEYGGNTGATRRRMSKAATTGYFTVTDGVSGIGGGANTIHGPHIVAGLWTPTAIYARLDGTASAASAAIALATGSTVFRMGANSAATPGSFAAFTARHAILTKELSAANRQRMDGWMAWDAGLTSVLASGHPYKDAAPRA